MNRYNIIRDDLTIDPITIITDGLLIGRLLQCEVLLNHPSVSRVQAGIKQMGQEYYLFPIRPSNPVTLNGKPVAENEALASGDVLGVGPFLLTVEINDEALVLRVSLQIGTVISPAHVSSPGVTTDQLVAPGAKKSAQPRAPALSPNKALDIFWDKRIREAGKMMRPSPLFPRSNRRSGKSQFNWVPTSDLRLRWPISYFIWAAVAVALISTLAAYRYANAYAPAALSQVHTTSEFTVVPTIAARTNAGSCTTCHSWKGKMEDRCAECHRGEAFVATITKSHAAAGVGCVACHAEHRGANFDLTDAALRSCTDCHNDANPKTYGGRKVGTPHGGTLGYPVVNGVWSLKAVDDDDWATRNIAIVRLQSDTDEKWRSKQFHALHTERVRLVPGLAGNTEGRMSCSTCHKSFDPIDRDTPRTTCGSCHNGKLGNSSAPNCTSCHVQHLQDQRRWGKQLL
jgi:hypothetical protein